MRTRLLKGPLRARPPSEVARIRNEAVEIIAVWHCNIRCEFCSFASPAAPARCAQPDVVAADLSRLASWMETGHVRILGGEPLMHPEIGKLVAAIRGSGISERVRMITNGILLDQAPDTVWRSFDEIYVSVYPNTARRIEKKLSLLRERAKEFDVSLALKYFEYFRVSYRKPSGDSELTRRIYQTCQIAHLWRSLTVDHGRIYRCPHATHVQTVPEYKDYQDRREGDFLEIAQIGSSAELASWLGRPAPLSSCSVCTGSVGKRRPHRQMRHDRLGEVEQPIDLEYLRRLEHDSEIDNDCVTCVECVHGDDSVTK